MASRGNICMRRVRYEAQCIVDLVFQRLHALFQLTGLSFELRCLCLNGFCLILPPFTHEPTDFSTHSVALSQGFIQFGLGFSALSIPFEDLLNRLPCIEVALVECGEDSVFFFAQRLDGEHVGAAD